METWCEYKRLVRDGSLVPPSGGSLEIGNNTSSLQDPTQPSSSPFGGIPRNWKLSTTSRWDPANRLVPPSGGSLGIGNIVLIGAVLKIGSQPVPPSGGSLEIGNRPQVITASSGMSRSPFGGIPRNWKLLIFGSELSKNPFCSPFGGIPRNWKLVFVVNSEEFVHGKVPPSGGSLEIGNNH